MDMLEALETLLSDDAAIAALVSDRIYAKTWPQGATFPVLTYQQIDREGITTQDGPSGLVFKRVQLGIWSRTYSEARDLADKVRLALDGFQGTAGGSPGVVFQEVTLDDDDDGQPDDGRTDLHWIRQDYIVWHEEAVS